MQQTINIPGAGTFIVPASTFSLTIEAWGPGGSGGGSATNAPGGGGGGYSFATVIVGPGQSVFYNVGTGPTGGSGVGQTGDPSWINPSANSQPLSNGVVATGGSGAGTGNPSGGAGSVGTINFTGGAGGNGGPNSGGGGAGGAGSAANGGNGTDSQGTSGPAGSGGAPDGGAGGAGGPINGVDGTVPGGGGGGGWTGNGGNGANGRVRFTWTPLDTTTTLTNKHGRYFSRRDYAEWLARIVGENEESRAEFDRFIHEAEVERSLSNKDRAQRDFSGAEEELNQHEDALFKNVTASNHAKLVEAKERRDRARKERDHHYFMDIVNKEWAKHNESKKK